MRLNITVGMDNAAFTTDEDNCASIDEIQFVLIRVIEQMLTVGAQVYAGGNIMDSNGNAVGNWQITDED